ncbi:EF-P lysine aminoacylase EpmA [Thermodesulforhabdus norvegica]|uniref:Lysyl-tRNA synthetase, class 2 n=1 Tax=Thermodesulforhabdus norvegica TaxID=39841 RepID=A0A1I4SNL4_9BACT|nr:EF-P lysine aminoacylase EpmA [Thermodesulforhabdus norvegica]SFM66064.1 lysyl-tRNA synthetase, class 2 [Thermodesulforhabdus norvegica]
MWSGLDQSDGLIPERNITFIAKRAEILKCLRRFFWDRGFLEVETPLITSEPAPEAHIEPLRCELGWLITSPELHMKRLIASGLEKIFQITRVFRKGELGKKHLPEFTMLEWYRAGESYEALIEDCRDLISFVAFELNLPSPFAYEGKLLRHNNGLSVITVEEAFLRWAGWNPVRKPDPDRFYVDLVEKVEPQMGIPDPTVLKDYPASESALARLKENDPMVCERFELYWGGLELANGFSELTDPIEQRRRFEQVLSARSEGSLPPLPVPKKFLSALSSLPPCAGIALGVDRLVMIITGAAKIGEVVAFSEDFYENSRRAETCL